MIRLFVCLSLVFLGSSVLFYLTLFQVMVMVWSGVEQVSLFWLMMNSTVLGALLQCIGWYLTPKKTLLGDESLVLGFIDFIYQVGVKDIHPLKGRQFDEWQSQLFRCFGNIVQLAFYLLMGWLFVFESILLLVLVLFEKVPGRRKQG